MAIVDRIKHDAPSDDLFVWKFPSEDLKLGSQLIVNQSQNAVFVKGGQALDVFGPGTHTLTTGNLPFLNKILNFPFGGQTPFTAEVWYVNKTVKRDLKWGTKGPIQVIDPVYQFPVSVRAFGRWGLRISNSQSFINQIVGSLKSTDAQRIEEFFIGEIVQRLCDALAKYFIKENISVFQVSARLNDLSAFTQNAIGPEFDRFGIEVVNFNVERISIPEDEQKKFQEILGKRMEIDQVSKASVGQAYVTMRTFDTLESAAQNSGGAAGNLLAGGLGLGMGVGAGLPIGNQMGQAMNVQPQQSSSELPTDPMAKLQKMKQMLDTGLITQQDYDDKKKEILSQL
jgi:membrane protease subunit (stomatin/prohibitin family)